MPVPFPSAAEADLRPPDATEVVHIARGFASAAAPEGGLTRLQRVTLQALGEALTGHVVDVDALEAITPEAYAEGLARRDRAFRIRGVQIMILLEFLLRPLPEEVAARVAAFAHELGVGDDCRDLVSATRRLAHGSLGLAMADFQRNGYEAMVFERSGVDEERTATELWTAVPDDPALAERWRSLEHGPAGSLGRRMWEFYRARGFAFPGTPDSAPPELAQHDWVHVLADYGTTVESELEVFGLVARAHDDPRAFTLLIQVLGLFESGYQQTGMGLFEMDTGHLSADDERMALRLGDAMRRGARSAWAHNDAHDTTGGIDYLGTDWFALADLPVDEVRQRFFLDGEVDKSEAARAAGSVGPWEPGGISPYQAQAGRALAEAEGRPYESYGAEP